MTGHRGRPLPSHLRSTAPGPTHYDDTSRRIGQAPFTGDDVHLLWSETVSRYGGPPSRDNEMQVVMRFAQRLGIDAGYDLAEAAWAAADVANRAGGDAVVALASALGTDIAKEAVRP